MSIAQVLGQSTTAGDITALVSNAVQAKFNELLASGSLQGPKGDKGDSGTSVIVPANPGLAYATESYYQPNQSQNFTGGSVQGVTQLSSNSFSTNDAIVSNNLTVGGSASAQSLSVAGNSTFSGSVSAATSTFSNLTASGPATFSGSTTIAALTVTTLNPGLTLGSVAFQGASGLTQDNANFFYDATNHRLGIGTNFPKAALSVGTSSQFQVTASGTVISGVWNGSAISIANGGTGATTATNATANLQFLQTGTGAVARAVESKLKDTVSVKDFGAKGDGVTDATAAINAAISAAPATNGAVRIPYAASGYLIKSGLSISGKTNFSLLCDPGTRIIANDATFDLLTVGSTSNTVTVQACYFQGASIATEGRAAIRVTDSPHFSALYNYIKGTNAGIIISNEGSDYGLIVGNTLDTLVGATSGNGYGVYTIAQHTTIANNFFINIPRHDVYISGSYPNGGNYSIVSNNQSIGNGLEAVAVFQIASYPALTGVSIHGNTIRNCVEGIGLDQNVVNTSIANNIITGCTDIPIALNGSVAANTFPTRNTIVSNTLYANTYGSGNIYVLNGIENVIANNTISDAIGRGISITYTGSPSSAPSGNRVINNSIVGDTATPVFVDTSPVTGTVVEVVTSNGNVGIGTTTPTQTLTVAGTVQITGGTPGLGKVLTSDANGIASWTATSTVAGGLAFVQGGNAFGATGTLGTLDNNALNIITNNTTKMTVLANGNVGIGTTDPGAYKLNVNGVGNFNGNLTLTTGALITNNIGTAIDFRDGSNSSRFWAGTDANGWYINDRTGAGAEVFRIKNGGNVGIGTTTVNSRLVIQGSGITSATAAETTYNASGTVLTTILNNGNVGIGTTTPTLGPLTMASGAYVTTGGVWTNASDRNLKENFATITPADILQKIDQLPVSEWNYKSEGASIKHIGPVAQDFYATFGLGNNNISISTIDPAGLALLGIQALDQKITALQGSLIANATTSNLTVYNPGNFSGDSVGEAKILTGQTFVRITFSTAYSAQPIITATPEDQTASGEFVTDRDAGGFTIRVPIPVTSPLTFAWHSFASPAERLTVSDGTTSPILLILPAAMQPPTPPTALTVVSDPSTPTTSPEASGSASSTPDSTGSIATSTLQVLGTSTSTPSTSPSTTPTTSPATINTTQSSSPASPPAQPDAAPAPTQNP